jgi:hypothetical protein
MRINFHKRFDNSDEGKYPVIINQRRENYETCILFR